MRRAVLAVAFLGLVAGGYYWWSTHEAQITPRKIRSTIFRASPDTGATIIRGSGTIEADTIDLMAPVPGRIALVAADAGDEVRQGELLFALDATDLQSQERQALAALEVARARLANASAPPRAEAVAAAEAEVAQAKAACDGAEAVWQEAEEVVANPLALDRQVALAQGRASVLEAELEAAHA